MVSPGQRVLTTFLYHSVPPWVSSLSSDSCLYVISFMRISLECIYTQVYNYLILSLHNQIRSA